MVLISSISSFCSVRRSAKAVVFVPLNPIDEHWDSDISEAYESFAAISTAIWRKFGWDPKFRSEDSWSRKRRFPGATVIFLIKKNKTVPFLILCSSLKVFFFANPKFRRGPYFCISPTFIFFFFINVLIQIRIQTLDPQCEGSVMSRISQRFEWANSQCCPFVCLEDITDWISHPKNLGETPNSAFSVSQFISHQRECEKSRTVLFPQDIANRKFRRGPLFSDLSDINFHRWSGNLGKTPNSYSLFQALAPIYH